MRYVIVTCRDYSAVAEETTLEAAIERCRAVERDSNDGYAAFARLDGKIVADAEGVVPRAPYYVDAATASGMYD